MRTPKDRTVRTLPRLGGLRRPKTSNVPDSTFQEHVRVTCSFRRRKRKNEVGSRENTDRHNQEAPIGITLPSRHILFQSRCPAVGNSATNIGFFHSESLSSALPRIICHDGEKNNCHPQPSSGPHAHVVNSRLQLFFSHLFTSSTSLSRYVRDRFRP